MQGELNQTAQPKRQEPANSVAPTEDGFIGLLGYWVIAWDAGCEGYGLRELPVAESRTYLHQRNQEPRT